MGFFWVDDDIFFGKYDKSIDAIIQGLQKELLLEREEDVAGFLGVKLPRCSDNNTITLTQTGITECILITMDMDQCHVKYTPVDTCFSH